MALAEGSLFIYFYLFQEGKDNYANYCLFFIFVELITNYFRTMKRIIALLAFILICSYVFAQDVVQKKNGDSFKAKVLRIDGQKIEYKLWDEVDNGPVRTMPLLIITSITYENGRIDFYPSAVYVDGDDLHDLETKKQIDDDLLFEILPFKDYESFMSASQFYSDARRSKAVGKYLLIPGSIMAGLGLLYALSSKSDNEVAQKQMRTSGFIVAAGGAVLTTIGVIKMSGKGKKMDAAEAEMKRIANDYNQRNTIEPLSRAATLSFGFTQNGIGFALNF